MILVCRFPRLSVELARIWASAGDQYMTIATEVWDDPAAWGIMLVDFARHISKAYEQAGHGKWPAILQRIREGFDAEWDVPTDDS